jgi:hypothetical protein
MFAPSGVRLLSSPPVARLLLVALLSLSLAQETSFGSLLAGEACSEGCPEDSDTGRCSPVCAACACGTRLSPVSPRLASLESPAPREAFELTTPAASPAEAHRADIAHVPIGASA